MVRGLICCLEWSSWQTLTIMCWWGLCVFERLCFLIFLFESFLKDRGIPLQTVLKENYTSLFSPFVLKSNKPSISPQKEGWKVPPIQSKKFHPSKWFYFQHLRAKNYPWLKNHPPGDSIRDLFIPRNVGGHILYNLSKRSLNHPFPKGVFFDRITWLVQAIDLMQGEWAVLVRNELMSTLAFFLVCFCCFLVRKPRICLERKNPTRFENGVPSFWFLKQTGGTKMVKHGRLPHVFLGWVEFFLLNTGPFQSPESSLRLKVSWQMTIHFFGENQITHLPILVWGGPISGLRWNIRIFSSTKKTKVLQMLRQRITSICKYIFWVVVSNICLFSSLPGEMIQFD